MAPERADQPGLRVAVGDVQRDGAGLEDETLVVLEDRHDTEGMTGTPYSFGPAEAHNPNRSGKIVRVLNGEWVVVSAVRSNIETRPVPPPVTAFWGITKK